MANLEFKPNKRQRMIREGKKIQQIEPRNTEVILKILKGFVTNSKRYKGPQSYRVMTWIDIEDDEEYITKAVKGHKGSFSFNTELMIPLDSPRHRYLYVELVRGSSWRDPGTSKGTKVMGRAKIKLPHWTSHKEFKSNVDLVGLNNYGCVVFKGYLKLSMKLHRYVVYN